MNRDNLYAGIVIFVFGLVLGVFFGMMHTTCVHSTEAIIKRVATLRADSEREARLLKKLEMKR